ncbi:MAG: cysteine peptidase family C39 domain-containing protein [Bacillota bacterium]|nr:cysteine peptidase family C39 domain-containing protein [Bacillota bacterium]HHT91197.1 hypothetical protein [Bacillota bacterium]
MRIWLVLFFHLMTGLQPYETTKYHGLISQRTPWDCGAAAAATLLTLAGQEVEPRLTAPEGDGSISLAGLGRYLEGRGWSVVGYNLDWEQLLHFFTYFPNRPILAHRNLEQGHYVVLLGLIEELLVVADPASGVRAVPPDTFLEDFSGYILYFPELNALSTVEKILASVANRLRLLRQSVAEF